MLSTSVLQRDFRQKSTAALCSIDEVSADCTLSSYNISVGDGMEDHAMVLHCNENFSAALTHRA
jgi:hypothetical protein